MADIDVYVRPVIESPLPLPQFAINEASAEPVRALMKTSSAQADLNSELHARGLPQICAFLNDPEIVTLGSNKDIWDTGVLGNISRG